jgi:hypothetical protein
MLKCACRPYARGRLRRRVLLVHEALEVLRADRAHARGPRELLVRVAVRGAGRGVRAERGRHAGRARVRERVRHRARRALEVVEEQPEHGARARGGRRARGREERGEAEERPVRRGHRRVEVRGEDEDQVRDAARRRAVRLLRTLSVPRAMQIPGGVAHQAAVHVLERERAALGALVGEEGALERALDARRVLRAPRALLQRRHRVVRPQRRLHVREDCRAPGQRTCARAGRRGAQAMVVLMRPTLTSSAIFANSSANSLSATMLWRTRQAPGEWDACPLPRAHRSLTTPESLVECRSARM